MNYILHVPIVDNDETTFHFTPDQMDALKVEAKKRGWSLRMFLVNTLKTALFPK